MSAAESSWSSPVIMGLAPFFHADPLPGGPPVASPDGHWWWNGTAWVPRQAEDLPAA